MLSDFILYLSENFPGLILNAPLFYRWPIGLRFDLGGRATAPQEVEEVMRRSTALFEAVFSLEDSCIVVSQDWPCDDKVSHLSALFDFSRNYSARLERPQGCVEVQEAEEPEIGPHTLTWVEQPARTFRYDLILGGIANADHARTPAVKGRVYFVNPRTNVIMHMYDDRGLDLIAKTKDALYSLYHDFNAWILEYDRARIERTFAQ